MAWAQYETRSQNYDPNGNLLISNRWHTDLGEFGALLGLSYTRLRYLDSTNSNTDWVANDPVGPGGANVRFPDIQRIDYGVGDRERPSMNVALQWRPAPGVELYADGLWQGFRNKVSDRELEVPLWGGSSYTNVVTEGSGANPRVSSLTVTDPFRPDGWQGATYSQTDTYQFAVGGKYDMDRFHAAVDIAHTQSRFLDSVYSMDMAYASPQVVTANTGIDGLSKGPTFHFAPGFDPTNASNYLYRGFYDRQLIATGKDYQARVDLAYDNPLPFVTRIEGGFRYVDRDGHHEDGGRYDYRLPDNLPFSAIPGVSYTVFHSGFPSDNPTAIRGYLVPTYDSIRSHIAELRAFSGFAPGAPPPDPALTFTANEKSYAGYVQAKYAFDLGVPVDGAIGVRVVGTDLHLVSTENNGGVMTPVNLDTSYTDVLPNLMARIHFTDKLQLRLSATETRTRPDFAQYDPSVFIPTPPSCMQPGPGQAQPGDPNCVRYGNAGNAALQPLTSKNYDASLEYYFSKSNFASIAVFRHELKGFISNYNVSTTDPEGYILFLNEPFNTGKGQINGVEVQGQSFMDWGPAWLKPFGVQANVTYLDPKTGVPGSIGGTVTETDIVGVSKWTYNLAGFYEGHGVAARLSWNYRSSFLSRFEYRGADPYSETTDGIGRLDFSSTYDLTPKLKLMVDATNLLGDPDVSYLHWGFNGGKDPVTFPRAVHYTEQVISLGLRFAF
jgi:TonB-dependent receptor